MHMQPAALESPIEIVTRGPVSGSARRRLHTELARIAEEAPHRALFVRGSLTVQQNPRSSAARSRRRPSISAGTSSAAVWLRAAPPRRPICSSIGCGGSSAICEAVARRRAGRRRPG